MSRPVLSDWEPYMIEVLHRKGDDRRVDQHGAQEAAQEGGRMSGTVRIGDVALFDSPRADKEQAVKVLEEAAEVFGA